MQTKSSQAEGLVGIYFVVNDLVQLGDNVERTVDHKIHIQDSWYFG